MIQSYDSYEDISQALTVVASTPKFTSILQCVAEWSQATKQIKDIDDENYEIALRYFTAAKIGLKQFEELRKKHVDVPTKLVRLINDMFRSPREELEKIKKHFSRLVGEHERKKAEEKYQEDLARHKERALEIDSGDTEGGLKTVPVKCDPVTDANDNKIQIRETLEVTVLNPETLLKAILSMSKKNIPFTADLITINYPALRKLAKNQTKIPGCVIKRKAVAR